MDYRKTRALLPKDLEKLNEYISLVGIGEYQISYLPSKQEYIVTGTGDFGDSSAWSFHNFYQTEIDGLTFADWVDLFRLLSSKDF